MSDVIIIAKYGQMISADDECSEINPVTDIKEDLEISHSEHKSEDGSTVMGHAVTISSQQDIKPVLAKLYRDRQIAAADHNMYAYRTGRTKNLKEGYFDDKEHGAGSALLKMLQTEKQTNVLVVVTRWFGGKHIGPKRFDLFKQCAKEALSGLPT
jgi:putative IMPACT (imprinted ancient) family translation regulator